MKKLLKVFGGALAVLILALVLSEGMLRWKLNGEFIVNPGEDGNGNLKQAAMSNFVQARINKLWGRMLTDKENFYVPPFGVFVNRGFEDEARMKMIAKESKLPLNEKISVYNFLRSSEDESSLYTVTSNSLGFRGREYPVTKTPRTYRILVLGSYPAFGHGVNDDETYAFQLEKSLNKNAQKTRLQYEVWNGGRQGGSSIMGVARLDYEAEAYKPDLIIWDYGWIEPYLWIDLSSETKEGEEGYRQVPRSYAVQKMVRVCQTARAWLKLCDQFINKYRGIPAHLAENGWLEAFSHAKIWAVQHRIPMIYVWHPGVTLPESMFKAQEDESNAIYYLNTSSCLFDKPMTASEIKTFWSKNNWIQELGYTEKTLPKNEMRNMYFGDAIQYNAIGYKRIADCLLNTIEQKVKPHGT